MSWTVCSHVQYMFRAVSNTSGAVSSLWTHLHPCLLPVLLYSYPFLNILLLRAEISTLTTAVSKKVSSHTKIMVSNLWICEWTPRSLCSCFLRRKSQLISPIFFFLAASFLPCHREEQHNITSLSSFSLSLLKQFTKFFLLTIHMLP